MIDPNVNVKITAWACTSAGGCVAGFITASMPYMQYLAVVISIVAGTLAIRSNWKHRQ